MEVPKEVLQAAAGLVEMYGQKLTLLGEKNGRKVYVFKFPKDEKTGFPFVYLFKAGEPVMELTGVEAVGLVASFDVE